MISSTQTHHPLAGVLPEKENPQNNDVSNSIYARLKAAGLRHTQPRLAIYKALAEMTEPCSIEQIFHRIKNKSCDLVTVYRSLALFEELGLVQRSFSNNGTGLYELKREGAPSFHVVCKTSGRREAIHPELAAELDQLLRKIELSLTERGYRNLSHRVDIQGVSTEQNVAVINSDFATASKGVRPETLSVSQ